MKYYVRIGDEEIEVVHEGGEVHIDGATLYQSRLSPSGPTYTALARANLTA